MKTEIINRHSVRTYQQKDLSDVDLEFVKQTIATSETLYNTPIKIELHKNNTENLKISTYGLIKNPAYCLTVVHEDTKEGYVDAGYALENVVLKLTKQGLGTCILGGTFKAKDFNDLVIKEDEKFSIVVTLGYAVEKKGLRDKMITRLAKAHTRKNYEQLFFKESLNQPLDTRIDNLEQVRLAPSAVNLQPWRVILKNDLYEFYIDISKKEIKAKDLRLIDLGIALAHFTYKEEFKTSEITGEIEEGLYPVCAIELLKL